MKELILEMEEYAKEHNVPIIEKESIAFIIKFIKANNIKDILEIGSAIGYSAILMASVNDDIKLTTIERDETRYMECLKNVKKCNLQDRISVVYQDALEVNLFKMFVIFSVSTLVRSDNSRISSATTANPLPASPALAASIDAFNASKFVWDEIAKIVFVISFTSPTFS